jgi:NADH:ubiquinone oxidoreductase subunit 6 (subunit J)
MSVESQILLEILQYMCFAGLVLSGLAALVIADPRKKAVSLFVLLMFITILSFVFYAGIMLFIANIIFIFVFAIFYLLVHSIVLTDTSAARLKQRKHIAFRVGGYAAAVLFCSGLGYIIFNISRGYFSDNPEPKDIILINLRDIAETIFGTYSIVMIILAAAALMTFISLTLSGKDKKKEGEVQE